MAARKATLPKTKAKPKATPKYAKSAGKDVEREMKRMEEGSARSGPGGKGGKVNSRKQAIAIGLSKARAKGKKVPAKKAAPRSAKKK